MSVYLPCCKVVEQPFRMQLQGKLHRLHFRSTAAFFSFFSDYHGLVEHNKWTSEGTLWKRVKQ